MTRNCTPGIISTYLRTRWNLYRQNNWYNLINNLSHLYIIDLIREITILKTVLKIDFSLEAKSATF